MKRPINLVCACAATVALALGGAGIAAAVPVEQLESVTTYDTDSARKGIGATSSLIDSLIKDTTPVEENIAYAKETSVLTGIPTKSDLTIQTMKGAELLKIGVPGFKWGEKRELSILKKGSQEVVSNPTSDGVQILWKINKGSGTESLELKTELPDGSKWGKESDGSISLQRKATDDFSEVVMKSGVPWAIDATGKKLPTSYIIDGDKVYQHVQTDGAVFPVVADPDFAWWGSLAICVAEVASIFVPGAQIIKGAKAAKAIAFLAKSPKLKKIIDSLGGLNKAIHTMLGKLQGKKYGEVTERALKKLLEEGKGALFDILGIGGCYGVYANW